MGFDNNQFITYRHTDTEHEHIHIVANRVRYSGRVTSDSNIKRRSREVLNDLEKKYGLTQTSEKANNKKALTQKEIEKTLRTGETPIKLILQQNIDSAITNGNNIAEFIQILKVQGIYPKFNISKSTGRVSGVSFKYENIIYKGSSLGRKYSWNKIIKEIDYEQDRDRTIILESNEVSGRTYQNNGKDNNAATGNNGETGCAEKRSGNTDEKSKHYLAEAPVIGVIQESNYQTDWTPFKLELGNKDQKKSKKKKKRKGLNL